LSSDFLDQGFKFYGCSPACWLRFVY
jgi:hypothetical protein